MDLIEALQTRRSIKSFSSAPVPREAVLKLVEVAQFSPSGGNKNPWRFVLITERKTIDRLSKASPYCNWLASAQAGIAIAADPAHSRYWLEDCCVAAYSICLAAMAQGLGAAWAAMYQSDNAEESERREGLVREVLSIPDRLRVPMLLGIGYAEKQPPPRQRPALEEIVHWERYTLNNAQ